VLPSAIFSEPPRLHVGRDAERMALIDPSRYEPHPKRRVDEGSVLLGNTEVTVVDMFTALLRRVAAEATQAGVPVGAGAVLTCPADWGAHRRGALVTAAGAAGLGPVRLVDEPVAAATYCLDVLRQQVPIGGAVAVFDFGGGTLDASVLRREPGGLRVLSVGGLDDLGGVDVDAALVGHLGQLIGLRSPRVWQRLTNPGPQSEQRERRQFWDDVRAAKEMLSRASSAPVHVPGMEGALHLTRDELERIAGPLVDRAVDETRRVVRGSGVDPAALSGLFLVGGSSRIPLVASRLHARFGISPTVPEQPELPVAYGGLLAAGGPGGGPGPGPRGAGAGPARDGSGHGDDGSGGPGTRHGARDGAGGAAPGASQRAAQRPAVRPGHRLPGLGAARLVTRRVPAAPHPDRRPAGRRATRRSRCPPRCRPVAPPMGPPAAPPMGSAPMGRPPRRRGKVRYFVLTVVVVLLAACAGTGVYAYNAIRDAFGDAANRTGSGNGSNGNAKAGEAGDLKLVGSVQVPGAGALTAAAGKDVVYYAAVADGKLTVAAHGADGTQKWTKSYPVEPTGVRIQPTGNLLVIDAQKAATHAGKDVRLVLDATTGDQKRLDPVENQRVVAYLGGDIVVETGVPSKPGTLQRIELATGGVRWTVTTKSYSTGFTSATTRALVVNAPDGPAANQGVAMPVLGVADTDTGADWHETLAADPAGFVFLDDSNGKATVWDGNGKAKVNAAAVPVKADDWTVYAGVLVGQLNDKASPGPRHDRRLRHREPHQAVGVPARRRLQRRQGQAVRAEERVRPVLGERLVLDQVDRPEHRQGGLGGDMQATSKPNWYVVGAGMIVGEERFGGLSKPELRDPATGRGAPPARQRPHHRRGDRRRGPLGADQRRARLRFADLLDGRRHRSHHRQDDLDARHRPHQRHDRQRVGQR
jgi:hypothetical protein